MAREKADYPDVVAVVNLKGGVGKTTLSVNLAYALAFFSGKRVLLVDLDPQANATQYLLSQRVYRDIYLASTPQKLTAVELYAEHEQNFVGGPRTPLKEPERFLQPVYRGSPGYLHLVASKLELGLQAFHSGINHRLDQVRWLVESAGKDYDIVFIDCPPTVSRMLMSGFEASQHVLVPIKPDFISSIGLPLLHRVITETYAEDLAKRPQGFPPLKVLGLVYTMYNEQLRMTQESVAEVALVAKDMGYPVFRTHISNSTKFTWSAKHSLPIFRTEPRSVYAVQLENLAVEFLENLYPGRKSK